MFVLFVCLVCWCVIHDRQILVIANFACHQSNGHLTDGFIRTKYILYLGVLLLHLLRTRSQVSTIAWKNPFPSTVDQLRGQVRRWLLINDSHSVLVFGSISIATFNSVVSCYIHKTKSKMATTALSYTPEPSEKVSNLHNIVTAVIFYQSR